MAGLHTGDWVDTKPTEQGGGVESLRHGPHGQGFNSSGLLHAALPNDTRGEGPIRYRWPTTLTMIHHI